MIARTTLLLIAGALPAAAALTGMLRRYAIRAQLLDVPNERSSHILPTPRAGGMSFVVTTIIAAVALVVTEVVPFRLVAGVIGSATIVAAIGFADDHGSLSAWWRLFGHFVSAMCGLAVLGGTGPFVVGPWMIGSALLLNLFGVLYVVWLINLTNFMDGIDGIASLEATTVCIAGATLGFITSPTDTWSLPLVLAAGLAGFLAWNWPPARIFMGDAGSGFIGVCLALFAIAAGRANPDLFWSWTIMLAAFVTDATLTLLRRASRGEGIHVAHRTHAYQHLAGRYGHQPVTIGFGLINLVWLFPIATLVALGRLGGFAGCAIAYFPIAVIAWRLGAGRPAQPRANSR